MFLVALQRKKYTAAYRSEAARLVIDTGRQITDVAAEIGVGSQLLGRWVAIERSRMEEPPAAVDADPEAELARLRVEVVELRRDREFLKKAAAFFAVENRNR
jgi:transposase